MKVWITSHVLQAGIIERDVVLGSSELLPEEWHTSHGAAVNHAIKMKYEEIKRLKAELKRVKDLRFGWPQTIGESR